MTATESFPRNMVCTRPTFARLLVGLEPVIETPKPPETVRCMGFTFQIRNGVLFSDALGAMIVSPTMQDVARNPVLPPWREWPNEIAEVPYPAQHRPPVNQWLLDPFVPVGQFFIVPINFWGRSVVDVIEERMNQAATWAWAIPSWNVAPAPIRVEGDQESQATDDTVEALVGLARKDQYDDFMWLAASAGVAKDQRDELWRGTRARLGTP